MRAFLLVWIQNMFIKYILFDQAFLSLSRYLDKNWSKNMYFNEHDYKVRWDSNSKCDLNIFLRHTLLQMWNCGFEARYVAIINIQITLQKKRIWSSTYFISIFIKIHILWSNPHLKQCRLINIQTILQVSRKNMTCKLSNSNFFITYNFFPVLHINLALSLQALFSKSCLNRIKSSAENLKRRGSVCYHLRNPMQNFLSIKMCLSQNNHSYKMSPYFNKICQICFGQLASLNWNFITIIQNWL